MHECSRKDEKWVSMALNEAVKSEMLHRHGCLAVSGGKYIAKGCNNYRTYSRDGLIRNCCSCHAEVNVLRKCLKNPHNRLNLYIVRISQDGKMRNSEPCFMCVSLMKSYFVKYIIYSTNDGIRKCKISEYTSSSLHLNEKYQRKHTDWHGFGII